MIVARGGNAALHVAGKQQFDMAKLFVLDEDLGAAFFQFAGDLRGIPFHGEIQIAQRRASDQVAHRAAGQINIEAHRGGKFLHARQYSALFRREPAFEQKHIIWHCAPSGFRVFAQNPRTRPR